MLPSLSLSTSAAFDLLQDEIDAHLAGLQTDIADTAKRGAYDKVGQLAKTAQELADLKKELTGVEKRYNRLIETDEPDESAPEDKRIRRGLKTPKRLTNAPSCKP